GRGVAAAAAGDERGGRRPDLSDAVAASERPQRPDPRRGRPLRRHDGIFSRRGGLGLRADPAARADPTPRARTGHPPRRCRRPPEVTAALGARAVAIVYAMLESGVTGAAVRVADVMDGKVDAYQREIDAGLGWV